VLNNYRLQKAKVSKVLLEGLFDQDSPLSLLRGVCNDVVKDIIWKKVVEKWQFFPSQAEWKHKEHFFPLNLILIMQWERDCSKYISF